MLNIELGIYETICLQTVVRRKTAELASDIEWTKNEEWKHFLNNDLEIFRSILEKLEKALDEA